jgi:hypothetical protein
VCGPHIDDFNDKCPTWASAPYRGPAGDSFPGSATDTGNTELSRDGRTLYVAASVCQESPCNAYDTAVVAYDARSGDVRWARRWSGPHDQFTVPQAVAVGGDRLFVTVERFGWDAVYPEKGPTSITRAYDGAGNVLWEAPSDFCALAAAASPDGSSVYVVGWRSLKPDSGLIRVDAVTASLDAATGRETWRQYVEGASKKLEGGGDNGLGGVSSSDVVADPRGGKVYVAQSTIGPTAARPLAVQVALAAYDERSGRPLGRAAYDVPYGHEYDWGAGNSGTLAVSRDGSTAVLAAFVVVRHDTPDGPYQADDFLTVAFDTSGPTLRWHQQYAGIDVSDNVPFVPAPVTMSPDGRRVYVTGMSTSFPGGTTQDAIATVAYATESGDVRWAARDGLISVGNSCLFCGPLVTQDPGGTTVFVTGFTNSMSLPPGGGALEQITVAHDAARGTRQWLATDQPWTAQPWQGATSNRSTGLATSPDGSHLLVATGAPAPDASGLPWQLVVLSYPVSGRPGVPSAAPVQSAPHVHRIAIRVRQSALAASQTSGRGRLAVQLTAKVTIRNVRVSLFDGAGRLAGRGRLGSLTGRGTVTVRLKRALRPGRYRIVVKGTADGGEQARGQKALRFS